MYPLSTIPLPPLPFIRLVDLLTNEEIAQARKGYIVPRIARTYFELVQNDLQGCLVGIVVFLPLFEVKLSFCILLFHISA